MLNYLEPVHEGRPFFVTEHWPRGLINARPRKVPDISRGALYRLSGHFDRIEISLRTSSIVDTIHGVPDP